MSLTDSPKINLEQVTKGLDNFISDDTTATYVGGRNVQNKILAFPIFPFCVKLDVFRAQANHGCCLGDFLFFF